MDLAQSGDGLGSCEHGCEHSSSINVCGISRLVPQVTVISNYQITLCRIYIQL
jgi:hypothetical protein